MNGICDSKKKTIGKRSAVMLAALVLSLCLIFSGLYIVSHTEHICEHNESCVVCACVQSCKKLSGEISTTPATFAAAASAFFGLIALVFCFWRFAALSLINLKIRLNN